MPTRPGAGRRRRSRWAGSILKPPPGYASVRRSFSPAPIPAHRTKGVSYMLKFNSGRWLVALAVLAITGCQKEAKEASITTTTTTTDTSTTAAPTEVTLADGLKMLDMKVGDGAVATEGSTVSVHYTG